MMKRVIICDKEHPWFGYTGLLTQEELKNTPGMYRVELDIGMPAGCYLEQLKDL